LREDNADERLTPKGREIGLVSTADFAKFEERRVQTADALSFIRQSTFGSAEIPDAYLNSKDNRGTRLENLFKRPELEVDDLCKLIPDLQKYPAAIVRRVAIELKYEGYIARERSAIVDSTKLERIKIPLNFSYDHLNGLRREIIEKLSRHRPENLGQAARISGVTPAAVHLLQVYLKQSSSRSEA
jgi:tRNA uridine 5-carboxymethylaminomethyl modification enzyme